MMLRKLTRQPCSQDAGETIQLPRVAYLGWVPVHQVQTAIKSTKQEIADEKDDNLKDVLKSILFVIEWIETLMV